MMTMELPHKWTQDTPRGDPLFSFQVQDKTYGFFIFSHLMWVELVVLISAIALVASLISIFVYHAIVKQARTTTAYLAGFGIVLPFVILAPQHAVRAMGIENKIFLFCTCVITPTTSIFRTLQAMFGFTPKHAQQSVGAYALFYGSPMLLVWDDKTQKHVKVNWNRIFWHLGRFVMFLFLAGMYQSMFGIFPNVFPSIGTPTPDEWYDLDQIWNPKMWQSTLFVAILFQLYLSAFGEGLIFATTLLTKRQTYMMMENPMFESKSPSEFWGRRWNLLVHECLKQGVYKPARYLGGSALVAVLCSFIASGLLHEWILPSVFADHGNLIYGSTSLFFVWQAMLISLEHSPLSRSDAGKRFGEVMSTWPTSLRAALVVIAGIPLGHWFIDIYIHSGYFVCGHMALFAVLPLEQ